MIRLFILAILVNLSAFTMAQSDIADIKEQNIQEVRVDRLFSSKYQTSLRRLRRTYPMALKAKELIEAYNEDLEFIDKKRKKKKYSKKAHQKLKDEFTYNIRDLYQSEGEMLMKLVYRETGMTVNDIIKNYRGGFQTFMYSEIAKLFGQDLNAEFDSKGDDWITEFVIQDIIAGNIEFDTSMRKMSKGDFRTEMKSYKKRKKENKKKYKKIARENKKKKRSKK